MDSKRRVTRKHRNLFKNKEKNIHEDNLSPLSLVSKEDEIEMLLSELQSLSLANEEQETQEIKFVQKVKNCIKIFNFYPKIINQEGKLLIKKGKFHQCWLRVILKSQCLREEKFLPLYFEKYKNVIEDRQCFQKFIESEIIKANDKKLESNLDKIGSDYLSQISLDGFVDQSSEKSKTQKGVKEEKSKLILEGFINKKRIDAEKVCMFFKIREDRKYKLEDVKITRVLENENQQKFQYSIVKAILPKLDEEKNCIICFKLFNFEQLLRIEYKFKEIFGFIIYQAEFDIVDYLDELMTKEEEEEDSS